MEYQLSSPSLRGVPCRLSSFLAKESGWESGQRGGAPCGGALCGATRCGARFGALCGAPPRPLGGGSIGPRRVPPERGWRASRRARPSTSGNGGKRSACASAGTDACAVCVGPERARVVADAGERNGLPSASSMRRCRCGLPGGGGCSARAERAGKLQRSGRRGVPRSHVCAGADGDRPSAGTWFSIRERLGGVSPRSGTARKVSQTRGQLGFFSRPRRQSSTGKIRAANSPGDRCGAKARRGSPSQSVVSLAPARPGGTAIPPSSKARASRSATSEAVSACQKVTRAPTGSPGTRKRCVVLGSSGSVCAKWKCASLGGLASRSWDSSAKTSSAITL